jgi:hypothetical protein
MRGASQSTSRKLTYNDPSSSTQHLADPLRPLSCPLCRAIGADAIGSGPPYRTGRCLPFRIRDVAIQQEDIRSVSS